MGWYFCPLRGAPMRQVVCSYWGCAFGVELLSLPGCAFRMDLLPLPWCADEAGRLPLPGVFLWGGTSVPAGCSDEAGRLLLLEGAPLERDFCSCRGAAFTGVSAKCKKSDQ